MKEIHIKTTLSLPISTMQLLQTKISGCVRPEELALVCLKKWIRKNRQHGFSEKGTCLYNREVPCTEKMKIRLSLKEHQTLKTMRLMLNLSVSFMVYKAIQMYLDSIVRQNLGLHTVRGIRRMRYFALQKHRDSFLKHIHRKISFASKTIIGMRIVIPLSARISKKSHCNDPSIWQKYIKVP